MLEDETVLSSRQKEVEEQPMHTPPTKSTTMTAFIYICQLRRIESDIQQMIYRVDKQKPLAALIRDVDRFMARLAQWKSNMPRDARQLPNFDLLLVDGHDNYVSICLWK